MHDLRVEIDLHENELCISPVVDGGKVDGKRYSVSEDFTVKAKRFGSGNRWKKYVVPKGFLTNLGSVPRPLRWLIPREGRETAAFVFHDWLYGKKPVSRKEADELLFQAMKHAGTWPWKREIIYLAVRMFGWLPWRAPKDG